MLRLDVSSVFCINNFIEEKFMTKTLKTLIRETKEDIKNLHGTPYLILHTRDKSISEADDFEKSIYDQFGSYPNQNQHLSGTGSDDHIYQTHKILSSLHPKNILDHEEHGSIYDYTVESHPTNQSLWNRHNEPEWSPGLPKNVPLLDRALGKFKVPSGGLTTFSGLRSDPSESAKKHPENKLFLPAYTSTTINPQISHSFARRKTQDDTEVKHIMKFKFPEEMNAGAYVGHFAHHPREYEFLTRRGMSVHLDPEPEVIPYKPESLAGKGLAKIWTAHPLSFHE
jgi:hypothetical protein